MKTYNLDYLISSIVLIFLTMSCNHEKDCIYENNNFIDSRLCISFEENGETIKYFQIIEQATISGEHYIISNSLSADRVGFSVLFEDSIEYGISGLSNRENIFKLNMNYSKTRYSQQSQEYIIPLEIGVDRLPESIIYKLPNLLNLSIGSNQLPSLSNIADTLNLTGFSLGYKKGKSEFSTNYLFEYYNYNRDSIQKYFSGSQCEILKVEQLCNNYLLVHGKLSTKVMKKPIYSEETEIIELKNVKFNFILK